MAEFGQTPLQLFVEPHPARLEGASDGPLLTESQLRSQEDGALRSQGASDGPLLTGSQWATHVRSHASEAELRRSYGQQDHTGGDANGGDANGGDANGRDTNGGGADRGGSSLSAVAPPMAGVAVAGSGAVGAVRGAECAPAWEAGAMGAMGGVGGVGAAVGGHPSSMSVAETLCGLSVLRRESGIHSQPVTPATRTMAAPSPRPSPPPHSHPLAQVTAVCHAEDGTTLCSTSGTQLRIFCLKRERLLRSAHHAAELQISSCVHKPFHEPSMNLP